MNPTARSDEDRRKHREYMREYRANNPGPRKKTQSRQCDITGCKEPHYGKGLCYPHYAKEYRRPYLYQYMHDHPEIRRRGTAKRKALKKGADPGSAESINRDIVFENYGGLCYLCWIPVDTEDWHVEHIQPLSRGGTHTYSNVAPAHPPCNFKKGNRTYLEFVLEGVDPT